MASRSRVSSFSDALNVVLQHDFQVATLKVEDREIEVRRLERIWIKSAKEWELTFSDKDDRSKTGAVGGTFGSIEKMAQALLVFMKKGVPTLLPSKIPAKIDVIGQQIRLSFQENDAELFLDLYRKSPLFEGRYEVSKSDSQEIIFRVVMASAKIFNDAGRLSAIFGASARSSREESGVPPLQKGEHSFQQPPRSHSDTALHKGASRNTSSGLEKKCQEEITPDSEEVPKTPSTGSESSASLSSLESALEERAGTVRGKSRVQQTARTRKTTERGAPLSATQRVALQRQRFSVGARSSSEPSSPSWDSRRASMQTGSGRISSSRARPPQRGEGQVPEEGDSTNQSFSYALARARLRAQNPNS